MTDHEHLFDDGTEQIPPSPTADDVREIMRSQNWKVGLLAAVLLIMGGVSIWVTADGRTASRNSATAVENQLSTEARSACITELRNESLAALTEMVKAQGRALDAAFFEENDDDVARFRAEFLAAAERGDRAVEATTNEAVEAKCGPAITAREANP